MTQQFTGRHMLAIMICFFGLVIAVNVAMARAAISTFGGEVVENSYVASQRFDGWLSKARAQQLLGWRAVPAVDHGTLTVQLVDAAGRPLTGRLRVIARHPLGRLPDRTFDLRFDGTAYRANARIPAGRWLLHIDAKALGHAAQFEDEVRT